MSSGRSLAMMSGLPVLRALGKSSSLAPLFQTSISLHQVPAPCTPYKTRHLCLFLQPKNPLQD